MVLVVLPEPQVLRGVYPHSRQQIRRYPLFRARAADMDILAALSATRAAAAAAAGFRLSAQMERPQPLEAGRKAALTAVLLQLERHN